MNPPRLIDRGEAPPPWWLTGWGRAALATLMLLALCGALRIARPLLLPLVLALLTAVVLAPAVRLLRWIRLPYPLAAAIVVAAFAGVVGGGVYLIAEPAIGWIDRTPETVRELEKRLRKVKESVVEAQQAADTVEEMTRMDGDTPPTEVTVKEASLAERTLITMRSAAVLALEVVILVFFLLAFGEGFLRKMVRIPDRLRGKIHVVKMTLEIEREISIYLLTIACINLGLGIATAIAMSILGMPNPLLWGVMAAVLNFVPYLGSAVTLVVLTVVAILSYDSLALALLVPAVFVTLATLEGQIVNPIIVGRRMSLSPLAIVFALMVGGWIWGVVGLLIAVPVLAVMKIYCAHDEALAPVAEFLGND